MENFILGMSAMAFAASGLFFLKFWKKTADRFFVIFAAAFFTLALDRVVPLFIDRTNEFAPLGYLLRLIAFLLILSAVIYNNREK